MVGAGLEEKIHLKTKNGKTGYHIKKFQMLNNAPGTNSYETIGSIYSKAQGSGADAVDFSDSELLAVGYIMEGNEAHQPISEAVIFDNEVFNQDIFIGFSALSGSTTATNYYLELETIALSNIQATQLTLKNLRQIASR